MDRQQKANKVLAQLFQEQGYINVVTGEPKQLGYIERFEEQNGGTAVKYIATSTKEEFDAQDRRAKELGIIGWGGKWPDIQYYYKTIPCD